MANITFDPLNIYIDSKIPTGRYLKIFLLIFNCCAFFGTLYFVFALQDEQFNIFPFSIPLIYGLTLGKYLLWNTFGEENYIVSTSHLSFQHSYGFWKTPLKTSAYNFIALANEPTDLLLNDEVQLVFIKFTEEKLQEEVFTTAISISYEEFQKIMGRLNEIAIDEFGEEINFPKIFPN